MRHRQARDTRRGTASLVLGALIAACAGAGGPPRSPAVMRPPEPVAVRLRARLAHAGPPLAPFYEARRYQPVWSDDRGVSAGAREFLAAIEAAADDGLDPTVYELNAARSLADSASDADGLARIDLVLTRLWLAYGGDLVGGRVEPDRVDSMWSPAAATLDLAAALEAAGGGGPDELRPPHAGYARLRQALGRYREMSALGGWDSIAPGEPLVRGARGPRIVALRRRLAASGDLDTVGVAAATSFDGTLESAVRRFQARHGLPADGRVGPLTLNGLNVPVETRVRQIELNLERWRWLPRSLGTRYVMVNSAGFALEAVEGDSVVVRARAIAGRPEWPTPLVSGTLTHVVLNPAWHVPRDITRREVLPAVRRDSGYLAREGIRVYTVADSRPVDPDTVDWAAVADTAPPYRFVQDPRPRNPLGRVKLAFANRFGVALHDTPDPALFRLTARAFSHGCVRIEGATDLTVYALRGTRGWSRDSILSRMAVLRERWITLAEPMPVHLVYWTAWVTRDGHVEFRDDVYGWDRTLETAISR